MKKTSLPEIDLSLKPKVHETVFISPGSYVMGDVEIGEESSIWYGSVLRGDINKIIVGKRSNIQDGCVLHVENDRMCSVGDEVTIGHRAILHGCTIEDACLIGMGAIVLNGVVVKKGAVIGAGALIKENTLVEPGLWVGVPAKKVKEINLKESINAQKEWALKYCHLAQLHKKEAFYYA